MPAAHLRGHCGGSDWAVGLRVPAIPLAQCPSNHPSLEWHSSTFPTIPLPPDFQREEWGLVKRQKETKKEKKSKGIKDAIKKKDAKDLWENMSINCRTHWKGQQEFKSDLCHWGTQGQMCLILYYVLTQLNYIFLTQFNYIPSLTSKRIFNIERRRVKFI